MIHSFSNRLSLFFRWLVPLSASGLKHPRTVLLALTTLKMDMDNLALDILILGNLL